MLCLRCEHGRKREWKHKQTTSLTNLSLTNRTDGEITQYNGQMYNNKTYVSTNYKWISENEEKKKTISEQQNDIAFDANAQTLNIGQLMYDFR